MRRGVAALQQSAAHNQTAAMMEIGSSLLNQTAAQTRKLTDVEAQVSDAGTGGPPGNSPRWRTRPRKPSGQVEAGRGGWGEDAVSTQAQTGMWHRDRILAVSAEVKGSVPPGAAPCSCPTHACLSCFWALEVSSSQPLAARAENEAPGRG